MNHHASAVLLERLAESLQRIDPRELRKVVGDDAMRQLERAIIDLRKLAAVRRDGGSGLYSTEILGARLSRFARIVNSSASPSLSLPHCEFEKLGGSKGRQFAIWDRAPSEFVAPLTFGVGKLLVNDCMILAHDPRGLRFETLTEPGKATLPEDLQRIRERLIADDEKRRQENKPVEHNGPRYAVTSVSTRQRTDDANEYVTAQLTFIDSDYLNFRATLKSFDSLLDDGQTVWEKYYKPLREGHVLATGQFAPYLFPSFGVNLAVITADDKLLIPQRSKSIIMGGAFNSSVNEGVRIDDTDPATGQVDLFATARRGLYEELGVHAVDGSLRLTCLGFSCAAMQFGALGSARIGQTWREMAQSLCMAQDSSNEIEIGDGRFAIHPIDASIEEFAKFLKMVRAENQTITSWGLTTFLLALITRADDLIEFGRRYFSEDDWARPSFIVPAARK